MKKSMFQFKGNSTLPSFFSAKCNLQNCNCTVLMAEVCKIKDSLFKWVWTAAAGLIKEALEQTSWYLKICFQKEVLVVSRKGHILSGENLREWIDFSWKRWISQISFTFYNLICRGKRRAVCDLYKGSSRLKVNIVNSFCRILYLYLEVL